MPRYLVDTLTPDPTEYVEPGSTFGYRELRMEDLQTGRAFFVRVYAEVGTVEEAFEWVQHKLNV